MMIMAKTIAYSPAKLATATATVIAWATGVDAAVANGSKALLTWGQQSIAGIQAGKITLDDVKASIITATQQHNPKACDKPVADWRIGDCGSTIKGRFYALARIAADPASCDKLLAGEAFNVVAKAAPQQQQQQPKAGGKGNGKGKGKPRAVTLATALEALNGWLDAALAGDAEIARGLAANADLALALAKVGKLQAVIAADAKATATASKAAKADAAKVARSQAAARKAKANAPKPAAPKPLPKGKATVSLVATVDVKAAKAKAAKARKVAKALRGKVVTASNGAPARKAA